MYQRVWHVWVPINIDLALVYLKYLLGSPKPARRGRLAGANQGVLTLTGRTSFLADGKEHI